MIKGENMNKNKIYVIEVCTKLEFDKLKLPDMGAEDIVGFYSDKESAFDIVINNCGDLHETCYDYALIEEVEEGIYPGSTTRWFFKFNMDTQQYEPISEPEGYEHFCDLII